MPLREGRATPAADPLRPRSSRAVPATAVQMSSSAMPTPPPGHRSPRHEVAVPLRLQYGLVLLVIPLAKAVDEHRGDGSGRVCRRHDRNLPR